MDNAIRLSDDKCAICGKQRSQHNMGSSGYAMCQIYPLFVSERAMFDRIKDQSHGM